MKNNKLSNVSIDYLCRFESILSDMIQGMTDAELTQSISHNFIVQMLPHHRAAIKMSENILRFTTNVCLQHIAENIILEQTKSINDLMHVQEICSEAVNSASEVKLYMKKNDNILNEMFCRMKSASHSNEVNCDFMQEMIPHHFGAVKMSENALKYSICDQLQPILNSIILLQKRGICQMNNLLKNIGCC